MMKNDDIRMNNLMSSMGTILKYRKKFRQLQLNPTQDKEGRGRHFKGKGKGNSRIPWQGNRNLPPYNGHRNSYDKTKGQNGGKGKGKQQVLGARQPIFTGTCKSLRHSGPRRPRLLQTTSTTGNPTSDYETTHNNH
jgi:hypothetical protein